MAVEPSVLIIDDDPTSALMLERIFRKEGFHTRTAMISTVGNNG